MTTIEHIAAGSSPLKQIKQLWRKHSDRLGYLPDGAFDDHANDGHLIAAIESGDVAGYILFRNSKGWIAIAHFCVHPDSRKKGVARQLLGHLIALSRQRRGIKLNCRIDFDDATRAWQRLGFCCVGESPGRAREGSTVAHWEMEFLHKNLFSNEPEKPLSVAIDVNVFIDLMDGTNEETQGLVADWIGPLVDLCYTPELLNEISRSKDENERQRRRAQARTLTLLQSSPEAYQSAEQLLQPLFPVFKSDRDESDFRQLVRALAAGADAFVTRDTEILERAAEVHAKCGLSVIRPSELIGNLDVLEREQAYQRVFIAGTRQIQQSRISALDPDLIREIQGSTETKSQLEGELNRRLASPRDKTVITIQDVTGTLLAVFAVDNEPDHLQVPIFRTSRNAKRKAGTIARAVLTKIARDAVRSTKRGILISDRHAPEAVQSACGDLGFVKGPNGYWKWTLNGLFKARDLPGLLNWTDPAFSELNDLLPLAGSDPEVASTIEHLIWPGKLIDSALPSFIVPIQPQFAAELFDERLARQSMFGADVDLALNTESAYYRAARSAGLTCPSRILWYVSKNDNHLGSKAIRACSRMTEFFVGKPKDAFSKFRRLGVFNWKDVLSKANGDLDCNVEAFRFDDTELLPPVGWDAFQKILKANDAANPIVSPVRISNKVFAEIYAAALNSPQVR